MSIPAATSRTPQQHPSACACWRVKRRRPLLSLIHAHVCMFIGIHSVLAKLAEGC